MENHCILMFGLNRASDRMHGCGTAHFGQTCTIVHIIPKNLQNPNNTELVPQNFNQYRYSYWFQRFLDTFYAIFGLFTFENNIERNLTFLERTAHWLVIKTTRVPGHSWPLVKSNSYPVFHWWISTTVLQNNEWQ